MLQTHEEEEARKKRVLDDEEDAASVPKKALVAGVFSCRFDSYPKCTRDKEFSHQWITIYKQRTSFLIALSG